jgi:hypothetical protein
MKTEQPTLNFPAPAVLPSGDIFDPESDCTLALTRDISLRRVTGNYTENDRKLWVLLVHLAFENLGKTIRHETSLRDISALWHKVGSAENGTKWLMDSAERLRKCGLNWEDSHEIGTCTMLSGVKINKDTGRMYYEFGGFLTEKLLDNKVFTRLRVHFMIGLSGKYSVALYMLLESLANLRQPTLTIPLEELRDRLNVPEGKLTDWRDFNKFALAPAIKQINESAEDGGFVADYRKETQGRKIIAVTFTVVKTAERMDKETSLSRKIGKQQATKSASQIPPFSTENYETLKRLNPTKLDIYQYESSWRNWCVKETEKTGKPTTSPIGSFIAYLVREEKFANNK